MEKKIKKDSKSLRDFEDGYVELKSAFLKMPGSTECWVAFLKAMLCTCYPLNTIKGVASAIEARGCVNVTSF